ncbi:hypothetical protein H4219_005214 [Mycoemilia scoparia]|uniref:Uncharacterized protein n=1 Tax=Mycoemilia scoparia TaxID=417184 RepID=A0A9W8DQ01_9FUNG|nr:hypothetical protein H4219_005214 [Mycoemilia scoparia]
MDTPYFTNAHDGSPVSEQTPFVETTDMSHHHQDISITDLDTTNTATMTSVCPHVLPGNEQHNGNVPQGGQNGVVHELYINNRPILHAPKNFDELWQMVEELIQWHGQETVDEVWEMVQGFVQRTSPCHPDEVDNEDDDDEDEDEE